MDYPEVVITSYARTAVGSFGGALAGMPVTKFGAVAVKAALERSGLSPDQVDEVIMGNVLSAGVGQAPARQAALFAGLPNTVETFTVNKVCGSGMKAVMLADQAIKVGDADIIIAGGMEAMSNVPYYMNGAREGLKMGNKEIVDGMINDGLWDVYNDKHMGTCGDLCATERDFSREEQDKFAIESYQRAIKAQEDGTFAREIVPVEVPQRRGDPVVFDADEDPTKVKFEKIPNLRPAFGKDGSVTAANASNLNDGAAALTIMSAAKADELGIKPVARIVGHASGAHAPEWFTTAPSKAIAKVLEKTGLTIDDIDLFEINEAFAVVALAAMDEMKIDREKVNVHGGAVAIGHPLGASGARIMVTLLNAMEIRDAKRGMAAICIGGGEAAAIIVERP